MHDVLTSDFRRRESAFSPDAREINDRSSYNARSVVELDALSAVGAILNTPSGIQRFLEDDAVRAVWLTTITHALIKRDLERLLLVFPTTADATQWFEVTRRATQHATPYERLLQSSSDAAITDPYLGPLQYAMYQQLLSSADTSSAPQAARTSIPIDDQMLQAAKARALPLLMAWISASRYLTPLSLPTPPLTAENNDLSLLLVREHQSSVKKVLRTCRRRIARRLRSIQRFICRFAALIGAQTIAAQSIGSKTVITSTHIPETFVCDGSVAIPLHEQQALLQELTHRLQSAQAKQTVHGGQLQHWIDPSRCCRAFDANASHRHSSETAQAGTSPSAIAGCHRGQARGSTQSSRCVAPLQAQPTLQWLPFDLSVYTTVENNRNVAITSEVNGIHTMAFPALYKGLELLLANAFVPLFERVLSSTATSLPPSPWFKSTTAPFNSVTMSKRSWQPLQTHSDQSTTTNVLPPPYKMITLGGQQLQMILKLSHVNLSPVCPRFDGEVLWQLDGDSGEQLVATGYHVLESDNLSSPELAFRAFTHSNSRSSSGDAQSPLRASLPRDYAVSDNARECAIRDAFLAFGDKIGGYYAGAYGRTFLQPWGSLALLRGRSFAAPSCLAHRLEPFELLDRTTSGRLTLVSCFLVDPTRTIASTVTLAPEHHDRQWVDTNIDMVCGNAQSSSIRSLLSVHGCSPLQDGPHRVVASMPPTHRYIPDELARIVADFVESSDDKSNANVARARRRESLEQEREKRHAVRFLHPTLALEQLWVTLPDV